MKQLLLIGRPDVGKTTFLAQLYGQSASLRYDTLLAEPVANLSAIIDAVKSLAAGEEVKATPASNSGLIQLVLKNNDISVTLNIPDYGGEQINAIVEHRSLVDEWKKRIVDSDKWLLFIRPTALVTPVTLANETRSKAAIDDGRGDTLPYEISDQTFLIELLQIFRLIRAVDEHEVCKHINLNVVLTCWDELETITNPEAVMRDKLPLLLDFIKSGWDSANLKVFGLSAQGFSLSDESNKGEYQKKGAESFAYFVDPSGTKLENLGRLIFQAAQ